ncbi:MAG TPA: MASE4 domain-containing protein [Pseudolabrys sp.]|nr:MASE4 domain-containing protein [Pseudolabrys sp.]
MNVIGSGGTRRQFLATATASQADKRVAVVIAAVSLIAFAVAVPFARTPLAPMPAFIPSYEAALFLIDLVTAVLLYDQAIRVRSYAVLVLAAGYLFDALIIVPHALSFPGAFAPGGLLGAGPQTTAWLYVFWHGGFPLFVIGYAIMRRHEPFRGWPSALGVKLSILASVVIVAVVVLLLTLLATAGHDRLPTVMRGSDYSLLVSKGISPAVWVLTLIAVAALWRRQSLVVDLWLMVVMWIWLFDIALAAVIGSSRYDLGFYVGRIFGLVAAGFLLITLLVEMARLYAGAVGAADNAEKKLLALLRSQTPSTNRTGKGKGTDSFVQQQNIAHYRALLEAGKLDDRQHAAIRKLLAEEEAKSTGMRSEPEAQ